MYIQMYIYLNILNDNTGGKMQKMAQYNFRISKGLIDSIDNIVKHDSSFSNRSEYIRTRLREDVAKDRRKLIDEYPLKIKDMLIARGAKPGLMTRAEKIKIANEYLKRKGFE